MSCRARGNSFPRADTLRRHDVGCLPAPRAVTVPVPAQVPPVEVFVPPPAGGTPQGPVASIPEPSSIALMLAGMLGAGALVRRRKD
jgi:PEP-CTERM motif